MTTVPQRIPELLDWAEVHGDVWNTAPASIGLTAPQVAAFKSKAQTARASVVNQDAANQAKLAATVTARSDVSALRSGAADLVAIIKGFAENSANPAAVYALAQIPPPAPPAPLGPPGTPFEPVVSLRGDGAVILKWKCNNPANAGGTVYEVSRRIGGSGAFGYIGVTGTREFVDETLPAGADGVTYQIVGVRSTSRGNAAQFNVNFGIGGPGLVGGAATVTQVKLAA
ncbi:MAG: hypothetical protein KGS45_14020 [Planctomycetes bacterium]|nr:hypothetical protein [Planctomycetota bacterium]